MATNPNFIPLVGSGFDSLASQRSGWAGFNAGVERNNMESFNRANDQRNNYIFNQQQIQRSDDANSRAEGRQDAQDAERRYNFGQELQLSREQLAATTKAKAGLVAADKADKKLGYLYEQAIGEIEARTFDPKNYKELPQEMIAPLIRQEAALREGEKKNYFESLSVAGELNKSATVDKWLGTRFTTDARGNKEIDQKSVKLNPSTGYYEPAIEMPAWLKTATKTVTSQSPATKPATGGMPSWLPRPAAQTAVAPTPVAQPLKPVVQTVQADAPIKLVATQQDYDLLPSGATYQDAKGNVRRKK